ncbi:MAG TPA: SMI1/KNR4 family protein [Phycisphaerae bacterium]|nr:SMI1/KNR4 family protein [Phycisphaerae bacterium]
MSKDALSQAFRLIDENPDRAHFCGPRDETLICAAENALGLAFPPAYRKFLAKYGCGDIAGVEIYGIVDDNFESSCVPDGIWATLNQRRLAQLRNNHVLVGDTGDGNFYAIDVSRLDAGGDCPVIEWAPDVPENNFLVVADSFGEFLHRKISAALDD